MEVAVGVFLGCLLIALVWFVWDAMRTTGRERAGAKQELAERTGPHRIIPYPDDQPGRPLHGAHRRGGRRG